MRAGQGRGRWAAMTPAEHHEWAGSWVEVAACLNAPIPPPEHPEADSTGL